MADDYKAQNWRILQEFPDFEVSDQGIVRRATDHRRLTQIKAGHIVPQWLLSRQVLKKSGSATHLGYWCVSLSKSGKTSNKLVHLLVASAFLPARPSDRHQAAHCNGNRLDNRATNLRWATPAENQADRNAHGTSNRGSRHGLSKIDEATAEEIIRRLADGERIATLAREGLASRPTITSIRVGKAWTHLPRPAVLLEPYTPLRTKAP